MASALPSLAKLGAITQLVDDTTTACINNFEEQLKLCSNSVQVHRRYAQFLLEVRASL